MTQLRRLSPQAINYLLSPVPQCPSKLYCTVLYSTLLYSTVLYCTVLYCTVLYCTVLYCTVLYCTVLYCTVLYCTVLYCTLLCSALLCSAMLCYTILYYTTRSNGTCLPSHCLGPAWGTGGSTTWAGSSAGLGRGVESSFSWEVF